MTSPPSSNRPRSRPAAWPAGPRLRACGGEGTGGAATTARGPAGADENAVAKLGASFVGLVGGRLLLRIVQITARRAAGLELLGHPPHGRGRRPNRPRRRRRPAVCHRPAPRRPVRDRLGRLRRRLKRRDRRMPDGDLRLVVDAVEVDGAVLQRLAVHLADVAGVEAFLPGVPVVEGAVGLGQVGVVEVAGIEGPVVGLRRAAIEHHRPHGRSGQPPTSSRGDGRPSRPGRGTARASRDRRCPRWWRGPARGSRSGRTPGAASARCDGRGRAEAPRPGLQER